MLAPAPGLIQPLKWDRISHRTRKCIGATGLFRVRKSMTHQQKLKQAESLGTLHVLWGLYFAADTSFGVTMERVVMAQPGREGSGAPVLGLQVSFI